MEALAISGPGQVKIDFDGTEGGLFQEVGKLMKWVALPGSMTIKVGTRTVVIDKSIGKHGGSRLQVSYSDLEGLKPTVYPWKMLRRVDAASNRYDSYEMLPHSLGERTISFSVTKGRIGAEQTDLNKIKRETYQQDPILFWATYYEKLEEGYEDFSDVMVRNLPERPRFHVVGQDISSVVVKDHDAASELFNILSKAAQNMIFEQLDPTMLQMKQPFTKEQIQAARDIWNTLGKSKNVDQFNSKIRKILALAPRRIDAYHGQTVASYLAKVASSDEEQQEIYSQIIDREDALIRSMEAVFAIKAAEGNKENVVTGAFPGITVTEATEEEVKKLKDTMFNADKASQGLKERVVKVWKIDNPAQNAKFDAYVKTRKNKGTKLLFHGSRTENWISIINQSLQLNPNAQINGKAFGQGIYFALSADKSFGYTSICRRYTDGTGSAGFMGVYETAYGKSANANLVRDYSQKWMDNNGFDCLHYHAGHDTTYSFVRDIRILL